MEGRDLCKIRWEFVSARAWSSKPEALRLMTGGFVHTVLIPGRTWNDEWWILGVCLCACVGNCCSWCSRPSPCWAGAVGNIYIGLFEEFNSPELLPKTEPSCSWTVFAHSGVQLPEHRYLMVFGKHQCNQDIQSSHSRCKVSELSAGYLCTNVSLDVCFSNLNYFSKLIQN